MTELNRKEAVKIEGRQYVVIDSKDLDIGYSEGDIATLTRDDGTRMPRFQFEDGNTQYIYMADVMLLAETEAPELELEKVTEFEVGTVYTSVDNDGICKNADGVYSYADFGIKGHFSFNSIIGESDDDWTIATAEQTAEFNKRKLKHQLDNLEVGEVYVITNSTVEFDGLLRFKEIGSDFTPRGIFGNHIHLDDSRYYFDNSSCFNTTDNISAIRPATAAEIAELEAAEIKAGDRENPAEPELPKHKFAVGDKLEITPDKSKKHYFEVGDVVTIIAIEEDNSHQNGIPKYLTGDGSGLTQYLLESQLKVVEKPQQFIPEVGKIYYVEASHSDWIHQVSENIGEDTHGFSVELLAEEEYWGSGYLYSTRYKWAEATPEQAVKLLQAKVDHSDATEADLKQLSELIPLDNPELTVGEVYAVTVNAGAIALARCGNSDTVETGLTGNYVSDFYGFSSELTPDESVRISFYAYRKALPHEVAQLEAAEKEHGCEYVKPLINSKGTVIEVGQYYSANDVIYLVTKIQDGTMIGEFMAGSKAIYREWVMCIRSIYGENLVPATPSEIEQFKQAEARANLSIQKGKKYAVETGAFFPATVTVTGITESNYQVKYKGLFGNNVQENISKDSDIWATAVEVK